MAPSSPSKDSGETAAGASWTEFRHELNAWQDAGRFVTFWWRDDGAEENSAGLKRLMALSSAACIPLTVSVIPARISEGLVDRLTSMEAVDVLQYGLAASNHGPADRPSELGDERPIEETLADISRGRSLLQYHFGFNALPVLVPPWNRFTPRIVPHLPALSIRAISAYGPQVITSPFGGTMQANVQVPLCGDETGALTDGVTGTLARLIAHLRSRRVGGADPEEPTGILTRHAEQGPEVWHFLEVLLQISAAHPAVRWLSATEVFGLDS